MSKRRKRAFKDGIYKITFSPGTPSEAVMTVAIGLFLRGERGGTHGLTPLLIRRLAPVISVSEEDLFTRAGHLSYEPGHPPVEAAILSDRALDPEAKGLLIDLLGRLRGRKESRQ